MLTEPIPIRAAHQTGATRVLHERLYVRETTASAATSACAALRRLSRATPPSCLYQAIEERAVGRWEPFWGFHVPRARPEDFEDRYPRPYRVQNDSQWSAALKSVPSPVVGDARSIENGWSLAHELHKGFLDTEEARQRCEMSSEELLNVVIHMRAALLQLYIIFSIRHRVLSAKYANPTLSANLHYALLASDDSEIVYSPKTCRFESSRLAHRMHSISREQAEFVTGDALPPETGLPIDTLLGSRWDP